MRFKQLDLNLLVALEVLLHERSVSAAAKKLCRTQPALSGSLARLREHFGDDLLIPVGRNMALTPFAETLIEPVRRLMLHIEQTVTPDVPFEANESSRVFSIAAADTALDTLLAKAISRVGEEAPNVVLDICGLNADDSELSRKTVDLMIGADLAPTEMYDYEVLAQEPYVGISRRPCARGEPPACATALFERGRVALKTPDRVLSPVEADLRQQAKGRVELLVPTYRSMARSVAGTDRIGVMPRSLAREYAKSIPLSHWSLPANIKPSNLVMMTFSAKKSDPGVEWLAGLIREVARRPERTLRAVAG